MIVSSFCLCDWDEEIMTSSHFFFFASLKSSSKKKRAYGRAHNKRKDSKDVDAEKNGSMAAALRGFLFKKTREVSSEAGRRANRPHWASSAASTPRSVSATWNEPWRFNLFANKDKNAEISRCRLPSCFRGRKARFNLQRRRSWNAKIYNNSSYNPSFVPRSLKRWRWSMVATSKWEVSKWSSAVISTNSSSAAAPRGERHPEWVVESSRL